MKMSGLSLIHIPLGKKLAKIFTKLLSTSRFCALFAPIFTSDLEMIKLHGDVTAISAFILGMIELKLVHINQYLLQICY